MKASDLNLEKDLRLNFETGIALFKGTRLVIFDANAVGLLRQNILEAMGWEKTRELIFRFGFEHGYSDCMEIKLSYEFESDMDYLTAGPCMHTWEGIVKATPKKLAYDRATGEFHFSGTWTDSYEAEQFLTFNHDAKEPVCWGLSGYASGYASAFFGKPLLAAETMCVGKGDEHCEWVIEPLANFGPEYKHFTTIIETLLKGK